MHTYRRAVTRPLGLAAVAAVAVGSAVRRTGVWRTGIGR